MDINVKPYSIAEFSFKHRKAVSLALEENSEGENGKIKNLRYIAETA